MSQEEKSPEKEPEHEALDLEVCEAVVEACLCSRLRRATRLVTQAYDEAFRPAGLRSGQFVLLLVIRMKERISIKDLAQLVGVDSTALGRNLKPLLTHGWINVETGSDRRVRWVSLTPEGQQKLAEGYPCWQAAQEKMVRILGQEQMDGQARYLNELVARFQSELVESN